jgi:parallel beta-helix repeat protein
MNSNNSLVSGNVLYDSGDCGIYLNGCFEMSVVDNEISDIGFRGIWAEFSDSLIIEGNYIADTGDDGIRLIICDDIIIHSNRIDSPGEFPIWIASAHNGEITFNDMGNQSSNVGIALQPGENWTIADNHFENLWGAIHADLGSRNIDLYRNDVVDVGSYWFALQNCVDTNIVDNSLRDSSSWGLFISSIAHRTLVQGNTLDTAVNSIYALADNITIEDNQILNSGYYAINTNSGTQNIQVIGNHILNYGAESGVYVSGLAHAIFENNSFTDCGIYFDKDLSFSNYNHSFIDNDVNGKPFYYAINADGLNLDGSMANRSTMLLMQMDSTLMGTSMEKLCW